MTICNGKDERIQVDPMSSPPYNWICYLQIESVKGNHYLGTGFKIHIRDIGYTAIVTAASCVYVDDAYASRITIKFPDEPTIIARGIDLYASPEYIVGRHNAGYDYGLIYLPDGRSDVGFGWSTELNDDEMSERMMSICGYPAEKPFGTMWISGGNATSHSETEIHYMIDTTRGQEGSPIYAWHGGYWTVIGLHTNVGSCPNMGCRITTQIILEFLQTMNMSKKAIHSVAWPNVYVRVEPGEDKFIHDGSGKVNCQYKPPRSLEEVYIYPPSMPPSLATQETTRKIVIESVAKPNVFVRMDANMHKPDGNGGGVVNCQYGAATLERYILKEESDPGVYSIISAAKPNLRLRVDGKGVDGPSGVGGGVVNCQYFDSPTDPARSLEKVKLEDVD